MIQVTFLSVACCNDLKEIHPLKPEFEKSGSMVMNSEYRIRNSEQEKERRKKKEGNTMDNTINRKQAGPVTRRLAKVLTGLEDEFDCFSTKRDFEMKANLLKAATASSRPSRLRDLYKLLDQTGVEYDKDQDDQYYQELAANLDVPGIEEMEKRMVKALYDRFDQYLTPQEYMERLVNSLEDPADGWSDDRLRLRILKQFIKYGNYLTKAGYSSRKTIREMVEKKIGKKPTDAEVLEALDDSYFDVLETATREQRRADGGYGLYKLADDLSNGKFRTQGGMLKPLYLFAIVYDMTYYCERSEEKDVMFDYDSDVEKRLFQDFYANNLMRFLTDAYIGKEEEAEPDPSGRGINYKNPFEIIYLYWLSRDLKPASRIEGAEKMIKDVQKQAKERGMKPGDRKKMPPKQTSVLRANFKNDSSIMADDYLSYPEQAFINFLIDEYTVLPDKGQGPMQVENEQNSAWEIYQDLRNQFILRIEEEGDSLINHRYGLCFADSSAFSKNNLIPFHETVPKEERDKALQFERLLERTDFILGYQIKEEDSSATEGQEKGNRFFEAGQSVMEDYVRRELKKEIGKEARKKFGTRISGKDQTSPFEGELEDNLDILSFLMEHDDKLPYVLKADSPSTVTRSRLLGLLYYMYNQERDTEPYGKWRSFSEMFSHFKSFADPYLSDSYYQELSGKNIFDVLLVYSAFARANL